MFPTFPGFEGRTGRMGSDDVKEVVGADDWPEPGRGVILDGFFLQPAAHKAATVSKVRPILVSWFIISNDSRDGYLVQLGWEQLPEIRVTSLTRRVGTSSSDSRRDGSRPRVKMMVLEFGAQEGSSPAAYSSAVPPPAGTM